MKLKETNTLLLMITRWIYFKDFTCT